jgi:adenylosuccinate synthase
MEYDLPQVEKEFMEAIEFLKGFNIVDSEYFINEAIRKNKKILAEGAQGSLLDVDFGSYPFVTSSNTMTAGACTGLGIAPKHVGKVFGIFKAYCTRVGSGPFPTEQFNEDGELIRKRGNEFGSTTGRPRRCGWIDLPALRYAIMLNGVTELLMMKADVLDSFEEIKVCTHYKLADGTLTDRIPYDMNAEAFEPVYTSLKGWNKDLTGVTKLSAFPVELNQYIAYLEKELHVPITVISVGPDRIQTIERKAKSSNKAKPAAKAKSSTVASKKSTSKKTKPVVKKSAVAKPAKKVKTTAAKKTKPVVAKKSAKKPATKKLAR